MENQKMRGRDGMRESDWNHWGRPTDRKQMRGRVEEWSDYLLTFVYTSYKYSAYTARHCRHKQKHKHKARLKHTSISNKQ